MKAYMIQSRLDQDDKKKFDEIKQMLEFEKMQGKHFTPTRKFAKFCS